MKKSPLSNACRFFGIKAIVLTALNLSFCCLAFSQSLTIDAANPATITDAANPLDGITSVEFNNGVLSDQTTGTKTTTSSASWTLTGAGEYIIDAGQKLELTGPSLSGAGNLTKTGDGELYFNLSGSYDTRTGTTTLSGGTLNVAVKDNGYNNQNLSAGGQLIFDGGTLKFTANGGIIFGLTHDIAVTEGNAVKLDIGTSYVAPEGAVWANKTFDVVVSNSNNKIDKSLALNNSTTNMAGYTGTITAEKYGRVTLEKANVLTATTTLQVNPTGVIEVWGAQTIDKVVLNGGTLMSKDGGTATPVLTANSGIDVLADSTIRVNGTDLTKSLTLTGVLTGTGAINKTGTQSLKLSSASGATYTGKITVSEGTLDLTAGVVGGDVEVGSNGVLRIEPGNNNNFSKHIAGTVSGTGKLIITSNLIVGANGASPIADLTSFSAIEVAGGRLHVKNDAKLGTQAVPVAITIDSGMQYWGQGTNANNLYIASVTVSGIGTENLGVIRDNLYNVPVTLAADSRLIQATITGSVDLQNFTLSTGENIRNEWNSNVTLAGDVTGGETSAINVKCTPAGTMVIPTTKLNLSGDSKLEVSSLNIDNGVNSATVNFSKTQDSTVGTLTGNGTLKISNGKLTVTRADDFSGALSISAGGTLALNGNLGAIDFLNIGSNGTLALSENAAIGIDLDAQLDSANAAAIVIDDNATLVFPTEYSLRLSSADIMSLMGNTINVFQMSALPESILDHLDFSQVGGKGVWNYGIANNDTFWISLNPNAVPEPSAVFLFALGLLGFAALRNKNGSVPG